MTEEALMDGCIKCGGINDLMINKTLKDGRKRYICRDCQRARVSIYNKHKKTPQDIQVLSDQQWKEHAKESNLKIMRKYA